MASAGATQELGIDVEGNRGEQRQAATQVAKQALKTAAANSDVVLVQLDTDTLEKTGRLEAGAIKGLKLPGAETMRKWLGSSAPAEFNLGVATAIIQMATLSFAAKDVVDSDEFSKGDNRKKFFACIASIFGNIVETTFGTVEVFARHPHPLSSFILEHWAGAKPFAKVGIYGGGAIGSVAGLVLAFADLRDNAPEAFHGSRNEAFGLCHGARQQALRAITRRCI